MKVTEASWSAVGEGIVLRHLLEEEERIKENWPYSEISLARETILYMQLTLDELVFWMDLQGRTKPWVIGSVAQVYNVPQVR